MKTLAAIAVVSSLAAARAASFSCETKVAAPAYVRPEGITELMADILLDCDGEVPAAGIRANVDLFFNTNAIGSTAEGPPLLLAGSGAGGWRNGSNLFYGAPAGINLLRWAALPLAPAGTRGPYPFRFANLRLNASMLGQSASIRPSTILFYLQIEGVEIRSPQRLIAVLT